MKVIWKTVQEGGYIYPSSLHHTPVPAVPAGRRAESAYTKLHFTAFTPWLMSGNTSLVIYSVYSVLSDDASSAFSILIENNIVQWCNTMQQS